jgi:hypothetical protein
LRRRINILSLIAALCLFPAAALAHSGMNRYWGEVPVDMLLSGDVLVVKTLTVPEGVTLTIEPGTVVRFESAKDGGNKIVVKGRLVAVGLPGSPIRFIPKGTDSGPWSGIEFQGKGEGRLERCHIEGASKGVVDPGKRAVVKDVTFK